MNRELHDKFKKFHENQKRLDYYQKEQTQIREDIERLIIKQQLVGKKFSVGDRFICYKKSKSMTNFTQAYIAKCLEELFSDNPRDAEAIMNYFLDNRAVKSRYMLEVTRKKQ